jgi:putative oxidoreductase
MASGTETSANGTGAKLLALRKMALERLDKARPVALLIGRLGVGLVFVNTGWGKVTNISNVVAFFTKLGIPAPGIQAVFASYTELLAGIAVVIGLCTRLAAVPLAVIMIVAIATAKWPDIHDPRDLIAADEFTYFLMLIMIVILGPGPISLDRVLAAKLDPKPAE